MYHLSKLHNFPIFDQNWPQLLPKSCRSSWETQTSKLNLIGPVNWHLAWSQGFSKKLAKFLSFDPKWLWICTNKGSCTQLWGTHTHKISTWSHQPAWLQGSVTHIHTLIHTHEVYAAWLHWFLGTSPQGIKQGGRPKCLAWLREQWFFGVESMQITQPE